MKWKLAQTAIVIAMLGIPTRFRLRAQNQSPPKQALARFTLATASYNFLVASGFLSEAAGGCPAVAQAGDGETIEITGAGRLDLTHKSVTAAGAFTQKTSAGTITSTGVWTATGLEGFQSYGISPFALLRDYPQLRTVGLFSMGHRMMPGFMMAGPMGGLMSGPLLRPGE
jgi:hypothetical protein